MEHYSNRMESNRSKRTVYHQTVVPHQPAQCPDCGSSKSTINKVEYPSPDRALRLHSCKNCPTKFKSFQKLTLADTHKRK